MIDKALNLTESIRRWHDSMNDVNKLIKDFDPSDDFCTHIQVMPAALENEVVSLLDDLMEGMASYYLYEASGMKGGGSVTDNGKTYEIKSIYDVKNYLTRNIPSRDMTTNE